MVDNKKILVLGGTGAIGIPLVNELSERGYQVYVTSRRRRESLKNITYLYGNARDASFITKVLNNNHFSAIVDFMIYETEELARIIDKFLDSTDQYIFTSSARVYAYCDNLITEDSPRLLDVCPDKEYVKSEEYAIKKARQEDIIFNSGKTNWTIIRPSLTYNDERLQFPLDEKEVWLYRALTRNSVVFPKDMETVVQTMTYGGDVSKVIAALVDNQKALGQVVHIAGAKAISWGDVKDIYLRVLKENGISPDVVYIRHSEIVSKIIGHEKQYKYARSVNRVFDNSKVEAIVGHMDYIDPELGLAKSLQSFIDGERRFGAIPAKACGYYDYLTGSRIELRVFRGKKEKLRYLRSRFCFFNKKKIVYDE